MTQVEKVPPPITARQLMARYDALLLDSSGVLVNEAGALPGATALLARLRQSATPFQVVTNDASRLPQTAARRYQQAGLEIIADQICSAGMLIVDHLRQQGLQDEPACLLGPRQARQFLIAANIPLVSPGDDRARSLILADTGDDPFVPAMEATISMILRALHAGRPLSLICANPDLIYPNGVDSVGITAGAMAALIEAAVAARFPNAIAFQRLGKPHPALFEKALARLGTHRALVVGDQLQTDILGAHRLGLDSLWIAADHSDLQGALAHHALQPTYALNSLAQLFAGPS